MRLRLTVRRHYLPETAVIWAVDTSTNPTVFNLLELVNETIPIESDGDWGLDDYAIEVKGSNGVNYECLHFQPLTTVLKDEDEVIIRPLLSRDIKVRRVSGRVQISADGKHLVDGVAWGRPLLRKTGDRPVVNIPPRKRQRITYNEDDEDPEGLQALKEKEAEKLEDGGGRQLILHAEFEDDDEDDDDDFAPGEDEDAPEDDGSEEDLEGDNEEEDAVYEEKLGLCEEQPDDCNEPALADVKDQATRAKIRKLHSAFPKSPVAVCKYVLNGSEDIGEAYEAMTLGFIPVKSKSAITEIWQEVTESSSSVPKTRSKAKTPSGNELENLGSMQVDSEQSQNALRDYYDQNGLPEGSIKSGRALSFMADAVKSSLARPSSVPRKSALVVNNKSVRFASDENLSNEITSTPFMDKKSLVGEESDSDSDEESDESSDEDTASSEGSSDSSDEKTSNVTNGKSSSESESDSSSDPSSSDDESPEEASSKQDAPPLAKVDAPPPTQDKKSRTMPAVSPGQGTKQTRARNQRRRDAKILNKWKEKGILPAGTTVAELHELEINDNTSPETALAALETVRTATKSPPISESTTQALSKGDEFELRRQELLVSLASGGIEVNTGYAKTVQESSPAEPMSEVETGGIQILVSEGMESQHVTESQKGVKLSLEVQQNVEAQQKFESQEAANSLSTAMGYREPTSTRTQSNEMEVEIARPSTAPESAAADTSLTTPNPPPASMESSQPASSRRAKLNLGAGRRLLFGALGIKTPKTKKDEEKVRNDLMKDVRPLLPTKSTDPEPNYVLETANEDPDTWREKIKYRAVECVQEGVELSEPPFPFVQRWDPQQQGYSWSQKGSRGGKRKKDQRDQAQYYHDDKRASNRPKRHKDKHNYTDEQEYLDTSYEPSYQDDPMVSRFDDSAQADQFQSDDVEGKINQQLTNDIQTPTAGYGQGPEDLAALPEDPSTLPDLTDGLAKVGMTIAFKILEMSEATKWQPQISSYRTAIVIAITETGDLQLTLAMRDRVDSSKRYDPETGERIYSKFEVPDDDEMEEVDNGGMLTLQFSDFIDPKIVQEPPSNIGGDVVMEPTSQATQLPSFNSVTFSLVEQTVDGDAVEPAEETTVSNFSYVTETPLSYKAPDSAQPEEMTRELPARPFVDEIPAVADCTVEPSTPSAEDPESQPIDLDNLAELTPEKRLEIAQITREAGFESSVPFSVTKDIRSDSTEPPGEAADLEKLRRDMSEMPSDYLQSPKWNGLGLSSLNRKPRESSQPPENPIHQESPQMFLQSSWETVDEPLSSPTQAKIGKAKEDSPAPASASAVRGLMQPGSEEKAPARKLPISGGPQMWQALQPRKKSTTPHSADESSQISPDHGLSLDGADERDSTASVHYPKFSDGSSFISQVADHGRQPDYNYEDNVNSSAADTPREPDPDTEFSHGAQLDVESEIAGSAPQRDVTNDHTSKFPEGPDSDIEPELQLRKLVKNHNSQRHIANTLEGEPLSDDEPPLIEEVLLSQHSMMRKQATSAPPKCSSKPDAEDEKTTDVLDKLLLGEDQTAPKPQNQRSVSESRPTKTRQVEKPASHPRESIFRASQSRPSQRKPKFEIPQGSQVMDLTMSSDAEAEHPAEDEDSDLAKPRRFKRYDPDDDERDEYEDISGWMPKKISTIRGVESRRQTSVGLSDSLQTSLNTRNRRKTTAR